MSIVDYAGEPAAGADRNQGMGPFRGDRDDQRASVTVDRDGIIQQWGDSVTEVVGYSADDTLGQNLNFVIPPVLRPLHGGASIGDEARPTEPRDVKVPALRNDGRIVVARASIEYDTGQRRRLPPGPWSPSWCRGRLARDGVAPLALAPIKPRPRRIWYAG